ncbi:MAG: hypothetical protein QX199_11310 [Methylococcaceae bacterium]
MLQVDSGGCGNHCFTAEANERRFMALLLDKVGKLSAPHELVSVALSIKINSSTQNPDSKLCAVNCVLNYNAALVDRVRLQTVIEGELLTIGSEFRREHANETPYEFRRVLQQWVLRRTHKFINPKFTQRICDDIRTPLSARTVSNFRRIAEN